MQANTRTASPIKPSSMNISVLIFRYICLSSFPHHTAFNLIDSSSLNTHRAPSRRARMLTTRMTTTAAAAALLLFLLLTSASASSSVDLQLTDEGDMHLHLPTVSSSPLTISAAHLGLRHHGEWLRPKAGLSLASITPGLHGSDNLGTYTKTRIVWKTQVSR